MPDETTASVAASYSDSALCGIRDFFKRYVPNFMDSEWSQKRSAAVGREIQKRQEAEKRQDIESQP